MANGSIIRRHCTHHPPPHHPLPSLRIRLYYVHVEHRYMHLVHIAGRVVVVVVVHALIWGPQNNVNN